jgi:hypothetical protein
VFAEEINHMIDSSRTNSSCDKTKAYFLGNAVNELNQELINSCRSVSGNKET